MPLLARQRLANCIRLFSRIGALCGQRYYGIRRWGQCHERPALLVLARADRVIK
jgi:hypothetical protein